MALKRLGDTQVPLTLTITGPSGGVTGLTGTVAVRRNVDSFYLDFADNTFKLSGWTTRLASLVEISASLAPGVYEYIWNSALSVSAIGVFTAEYAASGTPPIVASEVMEFEKSVEDEVWDSLRADHPTALTFGEGVPTFGEVEIDAASLELALQTVNIQFNADLDTLPGAINFLRKVYTNRRVTLEGSVANFLLYDDDDASLILSQDVTDKNAGVIVIAPGSPANRSQA